MYGIILIGVMVATGGAIAFIGDKLGTKIGKKRLSIFGLRPRHTSMIITVITGILITGVTIGAMAVVSKDVRTALFGMEELNAAMTSTKLALDEATKNLADLQAEFKHAEAELNTARAEISKLKTEQDDLTAESERLKYGNARLESENASLAAQNDDLNAANQNLNAQNETLATQNETLATQNETLATQNESLASSNAALEENNKKLSDFNVTLTADNEKLAQNNAQLEEHAKNLRQGLIAIREGDIVFRAGEILASSVLRGNQEIEDIATELNILADTASRNIAERFGEGVDSSVWIYQPEFQEAVENIAASKQDMVVRITAAGNLVRGEPIRTSLTIYPNNEIFRADEFIFADTYDVEGEDAAEAIVSNFLSEINRVAVAKGVLPDPITGSVGVMEGSQLYGLIDEIEAARGKIRLSAYAREDTRSIGPIRLNIRFEKVGG